MSEKTIRCFLAVTLPTEQATLLQHAIVPLQSQFAQPYRWLLPRNWHMTVSFIGQLAYTRIPAVLACVRDHLALHPAPTLTFDTVCGFPTQVHPKAIAAVSQPNELLGRMSQSLSDALGLRPPHHPFIPHITVAKARKHISLLHMPEAKQIALTLPLKTVALVHTNLTPQGSDYTVLGAIDWR